VLKKPYWTRVALLTFSLFVAGCGGGASGSGPGSSLDGLPASPPASSNTPGNNAPQISGTPPTVARVGQVYEFSPSASDADADALSFRITNQPEWATFDPATGRLTGTPPGSAKPLYTGIQITVTDSKTTSSLPAFDLTVVATPTNTAPTLTGVPNTSVVAGNAYEFVPQAVDPDAQALVFSISSKPQWAQFDTATGRLWGTPTLADVGVVRAIVIAVSDGAAQAALPAFDLAVTGGTAPVVGINNPPRISGVPVTGAVVGQGYSFQPTASDPDGQALTFSIANKPAWASFNAATGQLSGTPGTGQAGTYSGITIAVSDGAAIASLPAFTITVSAANRAPVISGTPATTATTAQAYSFVPTAQDADGDALNYSIQGKPSWASFSTANGTLSGTPATADVGTFRNIVISVSDGKASVSLPAFTITVSAPNRAPVISGTPATTATPAQAYSFTPTAQDADGDTLVYSIQGKPSWASFSTATGTLSGTPATTDAGTFPNVVISVSDGKVTASLPAFTITVSTTNRAPVISGTPVTSAVAGRAYSFRPTAQDADGDALVYSIQGKPSWATFDTTNGTLYGTPAAANVGTFPGVVISVSDGKVTASLPAFTITVSAATSSSVTVRWVAPTTNVDGTPISGLQGYRVHYGTTSGQYSQSVPVGSATITSAVIEGLSPATWYFAVKAISSSGVESEYSREASKTLQ